MVCIVQHPQRQFAQIDDKKEEGILEMQNMNRTFSVIPHQIRGSLHNYSCNSYSVTNFDQCPGCSTTIISEYFENGFDFVLKVLNQPKYLEDVCGLSQLQSHLDECDFGFDDDDDDFLGDGDDDADALTTSGGKSKDKNDQSATTTSQATGNDKDDQFVAI